MKKAIDASSFATATDLADWLVKNCFYTFREAYQYYWKNCMHMLIKKTY